MERLVGTSPNSLSPGRKDNDATNAHTVTVRCLTHTLRHILGCVPSLVVYRRASSTHDLVKTLNGLLAGSALSGHLGQKVLPMLFMTAVPNTKLCAWYHDTKTILSWYHKKQSC